MKRILYILIVVMLLPIAASAFTVNSQNSMRAKQRYTRYGEPTTLLDTLSSSYRHVEAIKRWVAGDTVAAYRQWEAIINVDSSYAPAHYYLSLAGEPMARRRHAAEAYRADSMNKWYAVNYATTLVEDGNLDEAIHVYHRITQLDHRNIQAYFALAILYGYKDMPFSAISILDTAEMRVGYNQRLFERQQDLLLYTRLYDRAIETGERRVSEHPYDASVRTSLAGVYEAAGRDSMARITLEEAYRLDSNNVATLTAIAEYYNRRGNIQEMFNYEERIFAHDEVPLEDKLRRLRMYTSSRQFYYANFMRVERIIQSLAIQYPHNRDVVDAYSSHMILAGNIDMAIDYCKRHLDDEGTTSTHYIDLMLMQSYVDDTEGLNEVLGLAIERFPSNIDIVTFVAMTESERGDHNQAIKTLKGALQYPNSDDELSELWQYIGDTYYTMGRTSKAFAAYRKSLDYNPDNAVALNNYAYFITERGGNINDAYEMAHRAVALEPQNATFLDTQARVLYLMGRYREAKTLMQQALSIDGQRDPDLLANYGDILWAMGETFMADTYWQKAVQRGYDAEEMEARKAKIKGERRR